MNPNRGEYRKKKKKSAQRDSSFSIFFTFITMAKTIVINMNKGMTEEVERRINYKRI